MTRDSKFLWKVKSCEDELDSFFEPLTEEEQAVVDLKEDAKRIYKKLAIDAWKNKMGMFSHHDVMEEIEKIEFEYSRIVDGLFPSADDYQCTLISLGAERFGKLIANAREVKQQAFSDGENRACKCRDEIARLGSPAKIEEYPPFEFALKYDAQIVKNGENAGKIIVKNLGLVMSDIVKQYIDKHRDDLETICKKHDWYYEEV